METFLSRTCCACLSSDRKIVILYNTIKKQHFFRSIWETPACTNNVPVSLCYECDALLRRFTKFKVQAQNSYRVLQNYTEKTILPVIKDTLQINKQFCLNLPPNKNDTGLYTINFKSEGDQTASVTKTIKTEHDKVPAAIKQECISDEIEDTYYSDDDDKSLIEKKYPDEHLKREEVYYKEKNLTEEEIAEERRCLALSEDYTNGVFQCKRCLLSFPNADDQNDHVRLKHKLDYPWKCVWCECTFRSPVAYNYHTSKHTRRYSCVACPHLSSSKRGAVKHYNNTHGVTFDYSSIPLLEVDNIAVEDAVQFGANGNGRSKAAAEKPVFACEFCDKKFRWKTSLRKHVETHRIEAGQKRRPYCEPCRLSFTTTANLQKHVKTSTKHQIQLKLRKLKESGGMEAGGGGAPAESSLAQIRAAAAARRPLHACAQCGRTFQWKGNLLRHQHSHAAKANGELVCEPCNRVFSSIATFKQHMKVSRKHVSENDFTYMCSDCGKRFPNKTRLKDHVDWEHLKNYVHKCAACQKVFKSHTSLYLHRQVVHKDSGAAHLCDHCGKPFANRAKLRSHVVALHTTDAPYACAACGARFSWHSCLSRHARRVHRAPPASAASAAPAAGAGP